MVTATLRVWPLGCVRLDGVGRCEVNPKGQLRLRLEGEGVTEGHVQVWQGGRSLSSIRFTSAERGGFVDLVLEERGQPLTVKVTCPGSEGTWPVSLWERQDAAWIARVNELYEADQAAPAQRILEEHKAEWQGTLEAGVVHGLDTVDWVSAARLWGHLAWELGQQKEAEHWFAEAVKRARRAGLVSDEIVSALWWDTILVRHHDDLEASRQLLERLGEKVEQVRELKPWWLFHLGDHAQRRGRLDEAVAWLDLGAEEADWGGAPEARTAADILRAELDQVLGRFEEARLHLDKAETLLKAQPEQQCRRADVLEARAEWVLSQRAHARRQPGLWQAAMPGLAAAQVDAMALFMEAAKIRHAGCSQSAPQALLALSLARAALLSGAPEDVIRGWFQAASEASGPEGATENESYLRERLALQGEWALEKGRLTEAVDTFRQLLERLPGPKAEAGTAADQGRRVEAGQRNGWWAWRAWIGLGQALTPRKPEAALDAYRHARAVLFRNSMVPPWGQGQGSFLGLLEWGAFLEVDLLRRQGRSRDALAVAREMRVSSLREVLYLRCIDQLDPARRQLWEERVHEYERLRGAYDRVGLQKTLVLKERQQELERQEERLEAQLLAAWNAALAVLGPEAAVAAGAGNGGVVGRALEWPRPRPREALVHCFPLPDDWRCWVTDQDGSEMGGLAGGMKQEPVAARQRPQLLSKAVAQLLERPELRRKLDRAEMVKVAVYGELRKIDWAMLSVGGRRLGEGRQVVTMLDLPEMRPAMDERQEAARGAKPAAPGGPTTEGPSRALVIVNPAELVGAWPGGSSERLKELLLKGFDAGWQVHALPGLPAWRGGDAGHALSREDLLTERRGLVAQGLGEVQLFVYVGHIEVQPGRSLMHLGMPLWHVAGGEDENKKAGGLRVTDVLALHRVPEGVMLLGCAGGLGLSEVGGLENLGLAHAFLLRGGRWAIASVRKVRPRVAGVLALALVKARVAEPKATPWDVLQRAVAAVRHGTPLASDEEEELNAFGVLVP